MALGCPRSGPRNHRRFRARCPSFDEHRYRLHGSRWKVRGDRTGLRRSVLFRSWGVVVAARNDVERDLRGVEGVSSSMAFSLPKSLSGHPEGFMGRFRIIRHGNLRPVLGERGRFEDHM